MFWSWFANITKWSSNTLVPNSLEPNNYYQHIISHVSHVVTCCTHYTSYSLLNLVHEIVCEFGLAIQDYMFFDFDTKYVHWLNFGDKMFHNLVLEDLGWIQAFWKTLKLILIHFIYEISWFECFLHKTPAVFQKFNFSRFLISRVCSSTDQKRLKFLSLVLPCSNCARSIECVFQLSEPNFQPNEIFKIFEE